MFATFEGRVVSGRLVIGELGERIRVLEGKSVAVTSMATNESGQLATGELVAGELRDGDLIPNGERGLRDLEGQEVLVVVRHELLPRQTQGDPFDMKYQLGQKMGDVDK
ncbi:hypothetical protein [Kribbella sp. NPDC049584]|uniref:hypothetical protein n=1 Tax=Kribbella sp. NPDC049584 TaxID=3154833 RepID=UPI00343406E3